MGAFSTSSFSRSVFTEIDRAKLEGCILGRNTKVGSKTQLIKCITQSGYEVADNGKQHFVVVGDTNQFTGITETYKHEKLDISDWTAAPDSEEDLEQSSGDDDVS